MSVKNINEIQSNDYRNYDQNFLKETLSALANSGQRYGADGQGIVPSYFTVADIFTEAALISDNAYSYIECNINVPVSETSQYISVYGRENSYTTKRSYIQYNIITKEEDTWNKTAISNSTSYFDSRISCTVSDMHQTCYCRANILTDPYDNDLYSSASQTFLYTIGNVQYNSDQLAYDYQASFDLYKDDSNNKTNNTFADIYVAFADTSVENTVYIFYLCSYAGDAGNYTASSYNIYYIDKNSGKTSSMVPADSLYKVHSVACDSYGFGAINYLYYNEDSSPYKFSHERQSENDWDFIVNKKGTNTFDAFNIKDGAVTRLTDARYSLLSEIMSDIVNNKIPGYESDLKAACLENEKKAFIDTVNRATAADYINEYIDDNGINISGVDDYISISTYFNPNFKFDVYVNSLDSGHIYSTANDIFGEYCTNNDISNTISRKIINASDNAARNSLFVADWTGIQREAYDDDYKKFDVYDRNVLYKVAVDGTFFCPFIISKYILPFINKDNFWCINGNTTPVRAVGYDSNASFIILYSDGTDNKDSISILSSLYQTDIKGYLKTETVDITLGTLSMPTKVITPVIDVKAFDSTGNSNLSEIIKFVKSSVIMSISKVTDEQSSAVKYGYITTFWVYAEKDESGNTVNEFRTIKDENNNVLDMSNLAGVGGIVEANKSEIKIEPDIYTHDQLYIAVNTQYTKQRQQTELPVVGIFKNFCSYTLAYDTAETASTNYNAYGLLPLPSESENDTTFVIGMYDKNIVKTEAKEIVSDVAFGGDYVGLNAAEQNIAHKDILNVLTGRLYKYKNDDAAAVQMYDLTYDYFPISNSSNKKQPSIIDTSSVLTSHANAINRLNIFSFGGAASTLIPNLYYSYIGTRFDDADKTHLTIGTSSETVDLSKHVLPPEYMTKMSKQSRLDIDFDNIYLNGFVRFKKGLLWFDTNTTYSGFEVYSAQVGINIPTSGFSNFIREKQYSFPETPYLSDNTAVWYERKINLAYYINNCVLNDNTFDDSDSSDNAYFPLYLSEGTAGVHVPYQVYSIYAYINNNSQYVIINAVPLHRYDSAFTVI